MPPELMLRTANVALFFVAAAYGAFGTAYLLLSFLIPEDGALAIHNLIFAIVLHFLRQRYTKQKGWVI